MPNTQGNVGEDSIEWHYSKIKTYFDDCFDIVYNPFLEISDDLVNALLAFVNNETHSGKEAEESKKFVNEMQIHLVEDTIYCLQLLQGILYYNRVYCSSFNRSSASSYLCAGHRSMGSGS